MRRAERAKQLFLLAGPHTWSAAVIPSLLPLALAAGRGSGLAPGFAVMAAAVLLQSAANALNDYADFVKGTDTAENSPEAYAAVVVNGLPPKHALAAGLAFMAAAALPGLMRSRARARRSLPRARLELWPSLPIRSGAVRSRTSRSASWSPALLWAC